MRETHSGGPQLGVFPGGMKHPRLGRLKRGHFKGKLKTLDKKAGDAMKAFMKFDEVALAEGAIPKKYKELIAILFQVFS